MAYGFKSLITFDHTKVPNTDQSAFPALISGTYADLATIANGGKVQNTVTLNGRSVPADLIFTSDAAGTTLLSWEVAAYNPATGAIEVWVKIPTLATATDTTIYMWYGDVSVTTYQCTATATWGTNYKGVWHLNDNAASTTIIDSTGSNNLANQVNTSLRSVAAEITTGISYNGSTDSSNATATNLPLPVTISGFFRTNATGTFQVVFSHNTSATNNGYRVQIAGSTNTLEFTLGAIADYNFTSLAVAANTIYFFAVTASGNGGTAIGYLAAVGSSVSSQSLAIGTVSGTPNTYSLGSSISNTFNGWLDEIHVVNVVRSGDWVRTEFNNQTSPSTFYSIKFPTTAIGASTEASDTATGAGKLTATGSAVPFEANDIASANGKIVLSGSSSTTEANDTALGLGSFTFPIYGTGATIEDGDTCQGIGGTLPKPVFPTLPPYVFQTEKCHTKAPILPPWRKPSFGFNARECKDC